MDLSALVFRKAKEDEQDDIRKELFVHHCGATAHENSINSPLSRGVQGGVPVGELPSYSNGDTLRAPLDRGDF
jgi:hypothetical protein